MKDFTNCMKHSLAYWPIKTTPKYHVVFISYLIVIIRAPNHMLILKLFISLTLCGRLNFCFVSIDKAKSIFLILS